VADPNSVAVEEIVWRGTSSQWKNFGVYLLCALLCWLIRQQKRVREIDIE
jgi:hypothetical protein